jgi:two-component system response regulator NreC
VFDARLRVVWPRLNMTVRRPPTKTITIVIADDHAVVRDGVRMLLDAEEGFSVVAEADDTEGTARALRGHHPDVLVLDLDLKDSSAVDAIPSLRKDFPDTCIVVLTMHSDASTAREVLRAGASGYVLKDSAGSELVRAIRAICAGQSYVQPEIGGMIASLDQSMPNQFEQLSEREVEVLRLVALGHTSREIAEMLVLSVRTVESHRRHLQEKLGCETRAELVRYALDHGLLDSTV